MSESSDVEQAQAAAQRVEDWAGADHFEDCPALKHSDGECDCPEDGCPDPDEGCDCYLGAMRACRESILSLLSSHERLTRELATVKGLNQQLLEAFVGKATEVNYFDAIPRAIAAHELLTRENKRLMGIAAEIAAEARLVPPGEAFHGGLLHGASVFNVMMWAVRRIEARAIREAKVGSGMAPSGKATAEPGR